MSTPDIRPELKQFYDRSKAVDIITKKLFKQLFYAMEYEKETHRIPLPLFMEMLGYSKSSSAIYSRWRAAAESEGDDFNYSMNASTFVRFCLLFNLDITTLLHECDKEEKKEMSAETPSEK